MKSVIMATAKKLDVNVEVIETLNTYVVCVGSNVLVTLNNTTSPKAARKVFTEAVNNDRMVARFLEF